MPFAWARPCGVQRPGVGTPRSRLQAGEPAGLPQRCASEQDRIVAAPTHRRHDGGSMACHRPRWAPFVPTTLPSSSLAASAARSMAPGISSGCMGRSRAECTDARAPAGLVSALRTVSVLSRSPRAVSRIPLALRRRAMIVCVPSGQQPRVREARRTRPLTPTVCWQRARGVPRAVVPRLTPCSRGQGGHGTAMQVMSHPLQLDSGKTRPRVTSISVSLHF